MTRTKPPRDPWMTLPQAGAVLKKHRQTIGAMALRGELGSMVAGGIMFVSRDDVERLAREQDEAGSEAVPA